MEGIEVEKIKARVAAITSPICNAEAKSGWISQAHLMELRDTITALLGEREQIAAALPRIDGKVDRIGEQCEEFRRRIAALAARAAALEGALEAVCAPDQTGLCHYIDPVALERARAALRATAPKDR